MTALDVRTVEAKPTAAGRELKVALAMMLDLPSGRLAVLASSIRIGKVSFPENTPLHLPVVASRAHIDGFERDIAELSPQGLPTFKVRLAQIPDTEKNRKTRARLQYKIDNAEELVEEAKANLATAHVRRAQREAALRRWLRSGEIPSNWVDPMVAALRSNVTYLHFMVKPNAAFGTLYVERG